MGLDPAVVSVERLTNAAREAGLLIDPAVEKAIEDFAERYASDPGFVEAVIARATPPQHGEHGWIEWADGLDPAGVEEEREDEEERADYYRGRDYASVTAGDTIGILHPPTDGADGRDIFGRTLKARPGKDIARKLHESLTLHDDGTVEAEQEGVLIVLGGAPVITRLLKVRESVDFSTGHIDFSGTVTIAGGIKSGFEVKARGDINVQGLIEVATLICQGDLIARCGMAGKGKGSLTVAGNVRTTYLEDARGTIEGDLRVQRGIVGCDLIVGGHLHSPTATLMGGRVSVTESLKIKILGSPSNTPTVVRLADAPLLRAARQQTASAISQIRSHLEDLGSQLQAMPLGANPSPRDLERRAAIVEKMNSAKSELDAHTARLEELDQQIASERPLDVRVGKIIYANVTLLIGRTAARFTRAVKGPIAICWDAEHQPAYRYGSGPAQPLSAIANLSSARDRAA